MNSPLPPSEAANKLIHWMTQFRSVAVAYSGGVDSAVVAKAAALALHANAVAVTAVSPSLANSERANAQEEAEHIGIRQIELLTTEFDNSDYRANTGNRCYHCKNTLYTFMKQHPALTEFEMFVNGTNSDDLTDYRPGLQAATEAAIRSPLAELHLSKQEVRAIANYWQLTVADKPAAPCLSSRIAYGIKVTPQRVAMIDRAEERLRQIIGTCDLRVRMEADLLARIEVPIDKISTVAAASQQLNDHLLTIGFRKVTLDLGGFQSGNLNQSLSLVALKLPTQMATSDDSGHSKNSENAS